MNKPVNYAAIAIKLANERIKKTTVRELVPPPSCIGYEIGQLNESGSFRIYEERDLGQIPEGTPSAAIDPEMPGHGLKRFFMLAFVHHEKPPMGFPASIEISLKKKVESVA